MMRWLLWIAILPLAAAPPPRLYTVESYDLSIQANIAKQHLTGEVGIRLHSHADIDLSALELDAGGLQIISVAEGQSPQWFERNHNMLFLTLTNPLHPDEQRTITVKYEAGPAVGLKFFPDQIYTSVTSDWMPCNNRPGERATLHLTITAPAEMKVAASGQMVATRAGITEWQLDAATEPSRFGFVLGAFAENTSEVDDVKLRVLGMGTQIFEPTAAAMRFLTERTGKHYPAKTYTQVFTHGDVIRSLGAGLTFLPESYAQALANQRDDLWLLASELAHQWYGTGVATKDWSDVWLSDGISAFLADAFLGQRFGKVIYELEIQRSRQIYNQIRAEGKDRPLSYSDWTTRENAGGEIPQHKGAWFLYLVNQLMGDNAFGNGMNLYTTGKWEQAATSQDIQNAFDAVNPATPSAGKKGGTLERKGSRKGNAQSGETALDNLFDMWVYGVVTSPSKPPKK